jgi:type IV secretory pathway VirB10-like protein
MRNVNWRKAAVVAVVWLGVGLVVALALVSGAGAKPQTTTVPTTVVATTAPPTTTLCNGSYKNCQPYPEPTTTVPADVEDDGDVVPPPPPPVAARPRTAG